MAAACDHKGVNTPFCPYCGAEMVDELPLQTLMAHVSRQALRLRNKASRETQASARRWEAWRDALAAVLVDPADCMHELEADGDSPQWHGRCCKCGILIARESGTARWLPTRRTT